MKNKLTALILIFSVLLCFSACSENEKAETKLDYRIFENNGSDMISFYMTSSVEDGVWEYSAVNMTCLKEFHYSEQTNDIGFMGLGGTASYRTLILSPAAVGEQEIEFRLNDSEVRSFNIEITADENDIYRIKCEEFK